METETGNIGTGALRPHIRVAVACGEGSPVFSERFADLLRGIDELGSISRATKRLGMSYSNAWQWLRSIEDSLGVDLIVRRGTRGSHLSDAGRDLLERYDRYERAVSGYQRATFASSFDGWDFGKAAW